MSSIRKLAIHGTAWTLVGYGGSQVVRLGGNIVLTRLLVPELFGLMALVNSFLMGLKMFSDIGISPSIIRSQRGDDPVFLNTAWTLQVIRGFALWLCCLLITIPIATFYGDLRLLWLFPVVGLTTVISGFNSTSLATLGRNIDIGKLTRFEFGNRLFSLAVMIVWAYFHKSIWALVGGNLASSSVRLLWTHRLNADMSNHFFWDKKAIKELISFGRWIFLSTAMTFLALQADRLILGKLLTFEMLGIYTIALTFADVPRQIVGKLSSMVIFPIVSKYTHLPRHELRSKVLRKRWPLIVGLALLVVLLATFGDQLILALYDQRYHQAAWMLPILALGLWPLLLSATLDRVLYAIGRPQATALGNVLKFLYMIVALPLGFMKMGVSGAVIVIALKDLPRYLAVNYGLWREQLSGLKQDVNATLLLIAILTIFIGGRYGLGFGSPFTGTF